MKKILLYQSVLAGIPVASLSIGGKEVGFIDEGEVYLQADYEELAKKFCLLSEKTKTKIELKEGSDQNFANIRCLYNRYLELMESKECKK